MLSKRAGAEIEFALDHPATQVVDRLDEQGIEAEFESYHHETRPHWRVTTDSSCGFELVSPILTEATVRSISPAMRAVSNAGGYITDRCGLHVHIELAVPDTDIGLQVGELYHDSYELLSPLFSEGRLSNTYARFCDDRDDWLSQLLDERYMAVNLQAIHRQGTVEFRQHQGTLSPKRAFAWLHTVELLTRSAENGGDIDDFRKRLRYQAPTEVVEHLASAGLRI